MHDKIANKKRHGYLSSTKGREGLNLSFNQGIKKVKRRIIITNNSINPVFININNPDLKKGLYNVGRK